MKTKLVKKAIMVLTCAALVLSVFAISPDATMAKTKSTLIKSQTMYDYNLKKKKWEKYSFRKFNYNKKKNALNDIYGEKIKWKYGKNKTKTGRIKGEWDFDDTVMKFKNGKLKTMTGVMAGAMDTVIKITYKKGNMVKLSDYGLVYKFRNTYYKNGILKKRVVTSKESTRLTLMFNKQGLIKKWYYGSKYRGTVAYGYNGNKQVKKVVVTAQKKNKGKWKTTEKRKTTFKYTNKRIPMWRYRKMINSSVRTYRFHGGNFEYILNVEYPMFCWY